MIIPFISFPNSYLRLGETVIIELNHYPDYTSKQTTEREILRMDQLFTCSAKEFVGTASAYTIGMVIATLDGSIKHLLNIPGTCAAIGIISSRTGTVTQALAIDDAVKASDSYLLKFEMAIDAGKQCGQGCLFILGADTVTDARRAVEIALERTDFWQKCLYINEVGHMECHVTPNAGEVLHQIFGAPLGRAFGIIGAAPAGIGLVAVDKAVKEAPVDIVWFGSPSHNLLMMNEFSAAVSGNLEAVEKVISIGKEIGCELLHTCGIKPIGIAQTM